MSCYEYELSKEIAAKDWSFYALLMALIRKADTDNLAKIEREWPQEVAELRARYNAPYGLLPHELVTADEEREVVRDGTQNVIK
jgi:hypothetical protein